MRVFKFLQNENFEEHADEIADVLDQLGGWACDSAQLDAKYPNDKYVKVDVEWRKKVGYCHD